MITQISGIVVYSLCQFFQTNPVVADINDQLFHLFGRQTLFNPFDILFRLKGGCYISFRGCYISLRGCYISCVRLLH